MGGVARDRLLFVDNIRWVMIVLVLSMHAVDTYSPFGSWYYTDRSHTDPRTGLIFGAYQSTLQAFFMALLFAIAGFFAVPSYDRKGFAQFARDRGIRLGAPTLLYVLLVGPITEYFVSHTWQGGGGFLHQWLVHLLDGEMLSETGPMWFAAVLLLFSICYAMWRGSRHRTVAPRGDRSSSTVASSSLNTPTVITFAVGLWITTFLVRGVVPQDFVVLNVHPGDFPQYALMFWAGTVIYRRGWLERWPTRSALWWSAWLLLPAVPLFAGLLIYGGALHGDTSHYGGGYNFVSFGKSAWESMVCVGASLLLVSLFRTFFDRQGIVARVLSDNAFAVYVFHPPVLILLAIVLSGFDAPAVIRAVLLTVSAALVTFSLSAGFIRRIPGLQRIL